MSIAQESTWDILKEMARNYRTSFQEEPVVTVLISFVLILILIYWTFRWIARRFFYHDKGEDFYE